jgi:hypothetical protein
MSGIPALVEQQTNLDGGHLDADLQSILRIPIERGGPHGIVGNGKDIILAWDIFTVMMEGAGKDPLTWKDNMCADTFEKAQKRYYYFYCMTCFQDGRDSFM